MGHPGAGKTFLAEALHKKTGIEVIDIDVLFDRHPFFALSKRLYKRALMPMLTGKDEWIIDGHHVGLMPDEMKRAAEVVVFLNLPKEELKANILARYNIKKQESDFSHWQGSYLNVLKNFAQIRLHNNTLLKEVSEIKKKSGNCLFIELESRNDIGKFIVKYPAKT